jgi:hypothetical protein
MRQVRAVKGISTGLESGTPRCIPAGPTSSGIPPVHSCWAGFGRKGSGLLPAGSGSIAAYSRWARFKRYSPGVFPLGLLGAEMFRSIPARVWKRQ